MSTQWPRAILSERLAGEWRLVVTFPGRCSQWPEYRWQPTHEVPTIAARKQALAELGYDVLPGAQWEWDEDSDDPDDPTSRVWLLAGIAVRPVSEVIS
ncbi:DUF6303 family protein [Streptomyces buecherae]|uniref:Uncharacterized protein n=1 Tax=Streptomyces buecherae TaxID=2763006 RepID=A0A7H8N8U5_9ACTN|nr:DUF6303 family protein [Streptomyces buecherae]QKW50957.1 hypothetical protein HUT08_17040 [Streptomyces buecherae]